MIIQKRMKISRLSSLSGAESRPTVRHLVTDSSSGSRSHVSVTLNYSL